MKMKLYFTSIIAFMLAGCSGLSGSYRSLDTAAPTPATHNYSGPISVQSYIPANTAATAGTSLNGGAKSIVVPEGDKIQTILSCRSKRIDYVPIPALPAGGYTKIEVDTTNNKTKAVLAPWPSSAASVNKLLTNISTDITQSTADISSGFGNIFSGSHSNKQYVIDFMKWRAEPLYTTDNKSLGWVRVGVGLRLIVNITEDNGSAGGSLLALAISAKAGRVKGSISTELIGMDAPQITQAMPFTIDLSEGNIQKVIEALAIVKAKLYDSNTTIYPNLIAKIVCAPVDSKKGRK